MSNLSIQCTKLFLKLVNKGQEVLILLALTDAVAFGGGFMT